MFRVLHASFCLETSLGGKTQLHLYTHLSQAHVSGNLITIKNGASDSLVIIGGRNSRVPDEENIIAKDEVEFCDEGMSLTRFLLNREFGSLNKLGLLTRDGTVLVSSRLALYFE